MIAPNLFDLVSHFGDGNPSEEENARTRRALAIIIDSSLCDWRQIREFEADAGPSPADDPSKAMPKRATSGGFDDINRSLSLLPITGKAKRCESPRRIGECPD
ncbi:MAG TPA: hypothetical protein VFE47_20170 [Tepidisphaeraceae bacterium]|jgi:hypothetical protein|nr:hypothetical protein [Tepidisphaeraceae bacterium]